MVDLNKEQALELITLQKEWMDKHPKATRDEIEKATIRIKFNIVNKTNKI